MWSGKDNIRETSVGAVEEKKVPPLKQVMRQFVRLVHPDLFAQYPKEREVNQKSLTELMTFIETWRKRPTGKKLGKTHTQTINFYLLELPVELAEGADAPPALPEGQTVALKKVKVDLLSNGSFSDVKGRLLSLFREANVAHDFEVEGIQFDPSDAQDLSSFFDASLLSAHEKARVEKEALKVISSSLDFLKRLGVNVVTNEFWDLQNTPDVCPLFFLLFFSFLCLFVRLITHCETERRCCGCVGESDHRSERS